MADLPDLNIAFRVGGLQDVLQAFKSIRQAAVDAESITNKSAIAAADGRVKAAKKEADEKIKEAKRAEKEVTEAAKRAGKEQEKAANEAAKAVEKAAKKAASESEKALKDAARKREAIHKEHSDRVNGLLGIGKGSGASSISTAFQSGGMGSVAGLGAIGAVMGGLALLGGAASAAAQALTTFGGFIINDVVKPVMRAGTSSKQLSNKLGGSVGSDTIFNTITGLSNEFGTDLNDSINIFSEAVDNFGNYSKASFATEMSMQANRVYGVDTKAAAGFIQNAWQKNPNATEDEMKGLMASMLTMSLKEKSTMSFGDLMKAGGKATLAASLFGGDTSEAKNKHMIASSGLLFLTKGSLGSTEETVSKQNMAWLTAANVGGQYNWKNKDGSLKDEGTILKDIFKRAGSDSTKIGKLGFDSNSAVYFSTILKKLSEDARGFDVALRDATEAGNVNVNALKEMSDKMKIEDPGMALDAFWQKFKNSFNPFAQDLLKVITDLINKNGGDLQTFVNQTIVPALYSFVDLLMELSVKLMDLIDQATGEQNFTNGERDAVRDAQNTLFEGKKKHIGKYGTEEQKDALKQEERGRIGRAIDDRRNYEGGINGENINIKTDAASLKGAAIAGADTSKVGEQIWKDRDARIDTILENRQKEQSKRNVEDATLSANIEKLRISVEINTEATKDNTKRNPLGQPVDQPPPGSGNPPKPIGQK